MKKVLIGIFLFSCSFLNASSIKKEFSLFVPCKFIEDMKDRLLLQKCQILVKDYDVDLDKDLKLLVLSDKITISSFYEYLDRHNKGLIKSEVVKNFYLLKIDVCKYKLIATLGIGRLFRNILFAQWPVWQSELKNKKSEFIEKTKKKDSREIALITDYFVRTAMLHKDVWFPDAVACLVSDYVKILTCNAKTINKINEDYYRYKDFNVRFHRDLLLLDIRESDQGAPFPYLECPVYTK